MHELIALNETLAGYNCFSRLCCLESNYEASKCMANIHAPKDCVWATPKNSSKKDSCTGHELKITLECSSQQHVGVAGNRAHAKISSFSAILVLWH